MTIEDLIEKKGSKFSEELRSIHRLILDSHPGVFTTVKYGLPFYCMNKNVFYIDVQNGRPLLALFYGFRLDEISELLDFTKRTRIGHYFLEDLDAKKYEEIITLIDAAIQLDIAQ